MGLYEQPPNYGDAMNFLGSYFDCGELGVIFEEKGFPNWVVKVVNQDAEDDENLLNMQQTDFVEKVFSTGVAAGIPRIRYFWRGEARNILINHIHHLILRTGSQEAINVLALEEGDEMGIWIMERLGSVGVDYSKPMIDTVNGVADAAVKIYKAYGVIVEDLHDGNYGQRSNGEFVIFDPLILDDELPIYRSFKRMNDAERKDWFIQQQVWVRKEDGTPLRASAI